MATVGLMCSHRVSNDGGEGYGVIMGRNMGGGKSGFMMSSCGVCWEGGHVVGGRPMGGYGGCMMSGGESVRGRIIFTFLLIGLVHWGFGVLLDLLALHLLSEIIFYLPSQPGVLLS